MKIFHDTDLDGCSSAYQILEWAKKQEQEESIALTPMAYDKEFPIESIEEGEQVWIVDFSVEPEIMDKVFAKTSNVIWIDHHKSSMAKYEDYPRHINGLRVDGISTCMLTFFYLNGGMKNYDGVRDDRIPKYIRLVNDWDVWNMHYGDTTKSFSLGMEMYDYAPESSVWDSVQKEDFLGQVVSQGFIVKRYNDQRNKKFAEDIGAEIEFEGYRCFAMNLGRCSSEAFNSLPPEDYDILISFYYNMQSKQYMISLYTVHDYIDVSKICRKHGGGGHKKASGFQSKSLPWINE